MLTSQQDRHGADAAAAAYATPSSDDPTTSPKAQYAPSKTASKHSTDPLTTESQEQELKDEKSLAKPKQKRNKPTLSCLECVERKTKCDRARPCLACVKRQSDCEYTNMANILASRADTAKRQASDESRFINTPSAKRRNNASAVDHASGRDVAKQKSTSLLSSTAYVQSNPSNVFGLETRHPFRNYWTCSGGVAEVISVLPSKAQSDILTSLFFSTIDPLYPFLHRRSFYTDYERFWSSTPDEKDKSDPDLIALLYTMYALGTQFLPFPGYSERYQSAEFYCSAAHQALRIYSYLNRTSMRAIGTMVLITYFLMNSNHASDAYAWAGIHLRQSYAMQLHRDPDIVVPDATTLEKQQRRKLWQAVFLQDSFLTALLRLPPTATHSDVPIESLTEENEQENEAEELEIGAHRVENFMRISVIAPQPTLPVPPAQPHHILSLANRRRDVAYVRAMWHLAGFVQTTLSTPMSLGMPIANSPKHKESLVQTAERLYRSFPSHLLQLKTSELQTVSTTEPRLIRQYLSLTSNYHHCLMLLHAAEDESCGTECNVEATLDAAHDALSSYFSLWQCFTGDAAVWWVFQHRAFEESQLIAHLLYIYRDQPDRYSESSFNRAKNDILMLLDIMDRYGSEQEGHKKRKSVLRQSLERMMGIV